MYVGNVSIKFRHGISSRILTSALSSFYFLEYLFQLPTSDSTNNSGFDKKEVKRSGDFIFVNNDTTRF